MKKNVEALLKRHKSKFGDNVIYCSEIELIIDELQNELNIPRGDIRKVIDSQFKMLRYVMSSEGLVTADSKFEEFKSLRVFRLGSFRPSKGKFENIQKWLKENKDDKKD